MQHVYDLLREQHLEPHDLPRRFPAEQRDHRIGAERIAREARTATSASLSVSSFNSMSSLLQR